MSFIEGIRQKVNNFIDHIAIESFEDRVGLIKKEREEFKGWSDKELALATVAFKQDLAKGKRLDTLVVPAFAVVNEAARRILGQVPFDVQILAGLIIHSGKVAEMKAGEGKTLTETMPVYLNALAGKGIHIITTNDYLAERDAKLNGKLFNALGLSVGFVTSKMKNDDRRKNYAADITYVTNQEVGFDYLRDNLVYSRTDRVLRPEHPLYFGIVDEIDSILIDESRTPLIIAEPEKEERNYYEQFNDIVEDLEEDKDYLVDYKNKNVSMTTEGLDKVEKVLGSPVFSKDNPMYVFYLDVCLKAKIVFEKDRDYIVSSDGVEIVDEFTGRVLPGRRFTDGVHQAIEAKEGVKIKDADRTAAAITFQNFFPMYEKLSGMSGTVMRARDEFAQVYKLDVVQIPTNRPLARTDHNDLFFKTEKGKFLGLVKKVRQIHKRGQPLLIGSRNVEVAHKVAAILEDQSLPFQLLTAADHKSEAEKIAKAGQEGMITIATNMAGRGTDILLGTGVAEKGGLYVLGTERHESRRIDDQLIGRSGRQGDAGESQFLISMEDEIMQLFGSEKVIDVLEEYDIPEDEYISGKSLDQAFQKAQNFVESKNLDSRLYLYKYDSITNYQRKHFYNFRDSLLENEQELENFLTVSIQEIVRNVFSLQDPKLISQHFREIFSFEISPEELKEVLKNKDKNSGKTTYLEEVLNKTANFLVSQSNAIKNNSEVWAASQNLALEILDYHWSQHLDYSEVLKEEAGLFSYASEDPLIDYISESQKLFSEMFINAKKQFLSTIFKRLNQQGSLG